LREYSIPALAEIPASANTADLVTRRAAEQPSSVMLRRKTAEGTWSDVTAGQFRYEVQALAKGFIAAGVEAGDRIALMSHTRYEWTLIDYALWSVGAVGDLEKARGRELDRESRLKLVSQAIGRNIASTNELTREEASQAIDSIKRETDALTASRAEAEPNEAPTQEGTPDAG